MPVLGVWERIAEAELKPTQAQREQTNSKQSYHIPMARFWLEDSQKEESFWGTTNWPKEKKVL